MNISLLPKAVERRFHVAAHLIRRNSGPLTFRLDPRLGDVTFHVGIMSHDSMVEFRLGRWLLAVFRIP